MFTKVFGMYLESKKQFHFQECNNWWWRSVHLNLTQNMVVN